MTMESSNPPKIELPALVVPLLKGVIYRESDPGLLNGLLTLAPRVRDYVAVMGLDLVCDESEGYAFLRSRQAGNAAPSDDDAEQGQPRLIARRRGACRTGGGLRGATHFESVRRCAMAG